MTSKDYIEISADLDSIEERIEALERRLGIA